MGEKWVISPVRSIDLYISFRYLFDSHHLREIRVWQVSQDVIGSSPITGIYSQPRVAQG